MKVCWKTEELCSLVDLVEKAKSRCEERLTELKNIQKSHVESLNRLQRMFCDDKWTENGFKVRMFGANLRDLAKLLEKIKFYNGAYTLTLTSDESELVYKWTQKDK